MSEFWNGFAVGGGIVFVVILLIEGAYNRGIKDGRKKKGATNDS